MLKCSVKIIFGGLDSNYKAVPNASVTGGVITRKYHRLSGNFLIFDVKIVIYVISWHQISGIAAITTIYWRVNRFCRVNSICIQISCQYWQDFTCEILLW